MIQFVLSDSILSFSFSSKSSIITLPKTIENMSPEDQDMIKQFTLYVREIYIEKVNKFMSTGNGKRLCAIQFRYESIREAVKYFQDKYTQEVFNPVYAQFLSLSRGKIKSLRKNKLLDKPKVKTATLLDFIEDNITL